MAITKVQVRLAPNSGLPEDVVTNTFHLDGTDGTEAGDAGPAAAIIDFYTAIGVSLGATLSRTTNACEIRFYNVADPEPREPYGIYPFTLPSASGVAGLPLECSLCLSYRAPLVSGTNPRRRRGRIYLGPLVAGIATTEATTNVPRPATATLNGILAEFNDMVDTMRTSDGVVFSVRSEVSGLTVPVQLAWMDNEFDTQRRRGRKASARSEVVVYEVP